MPNQPSRPLAIVTGASAGLGVEFARQLAAEGYDLILVARRLDRLTVLGSELTAAHGISAVPLQIDLSLPDARDRVAAAMAGQNRTADMLINNAGLSIADQFAATSWERENAMLMTLVNAVVALSHLVLPAMIARGKGRIINVASVAGFAPGVAGHTLYPASKSFVIKFSQSLDAETRGKGILVSALCPGYTETEFQVASGMADLAANGRRTKGADPADVVRQGLAENAAGHVIIVTGVSNKLARMALKVMPEALSRPLINYGASRFRRD